MIATLDFSYVSSPAHEWITAVCLMTRGIVVCVEFKHAVNPTVRA
jgi:hypothetical protein